MTEKKECSEGMCCPLTGCPVKKVIVTWLFVLATVFGYEYAFHQMYMMPDYVATAGLWRDEAAMQALGHICMIRLAVMSFVIAGLYCWVSRAQQGCCTKFGIKFGAMIGLLIGIQSFGAYVYMPIPYEMAVKWLIGEVLMGVVIGVVLSFVGKCCKK